MKDFIKLIGWLCLLPVLTGCGNDEDVSGTPEASDLPILVSLAQDKQSGSSRATIFEDADDLKDVSKGGGNFHLNAYYLETGKEPQTYLNAQVKYFKDADDAGLYDPWRFYNGTDYYHAYWPKNGMLDFLAYMPYEESKRTYITNITYPTGGGISFHAALPSNVTIDEVAPNEFIYAYRKGMTSASSNLDSHGRLELNFAHPFAVVYFKLKQSLRYKLNSIKFFKPEETGICKKGTYLASGDTKNASVGSWSDLDESTPYFINLGGKQIPDDINFNTVFAGPFLVIPQSVEGVKMVINVTDASSETKDLPEVSIDGTVSSWEPGKRYTYILDMGDPNTEILFNVEVEAWEVINYDDIINIG